MPVTRERVDPQRDQSDLGLVHRRWIVPDDVQRPMPLQSLSRLWRGLIELRVLDPGAEARLSRAGGETLELPVDASPGALLAGTGLPARDFRGREGDLLEAVIDRLHPEIHPSIGLNSFPISNHQPEFAAFCATAVADQAVFDGALAMAWTIIDAATSQAVRERLLAKRGPAKSS